MRLQVRAFLLPSCGRWRAGTASVTSRLPFLVLRMSDIISRRQRSPWFWPDFVYYCFGDGREHDSTLKVLQSFTYKVRS